MIKNFPLRDFQQYGFQWVLEGKYQKFVEKGSSLKEFINFIEEDIRLNKVFYTKVIDFTLEVVMKKIFLEKGR